MILVPAVSALAVLGGLLSLVVAVLVSTLDPGDFVPKVAEHGPLRPDGGKNQG